MQMLFGTAVNLYAFQEDKNTMAPTAEIALMMLEPQYDLANGGEVTKSQKITTTRFCVCEDGIEYLLKTIQQVQVELREMAERLKPKTEAAP